MWRSGNVWDHPILRARRRDNSSSTTVTLPSGRSAGSAARSLTTSRHTVGKGADIQLDAQRLGPGGQDGQGLRVHVRIDHEPVAAAHPVREGHRLGGGGRLVEQGRVGHRQTAQFRDQGLEGQQSLQPPLGDLRLIGRVRGVPRGVLQDIPGDDGRRDAPVVSQPDHAAPGAVAVGEFPQQATNGGLVHRIG